MTSPESEAPYRKPGVPSRCPEARAGGIKPVLVDMVEGDIAIARRYGDAPKIDG